MFVGNAVRFASSRMAFSGAARRTFASVATKTVKNDSARRAAPLVAAAGFAFGASTFLGSRQVR